MPPAKRDHQPRPPQDGGSLPPRARRWWSAWVLAALLIGPAVLVWLQQRADQGVPWWVFVVGVALVAGTEAASVRAGTARGAQAINLVDAALVTLLLLVPASVALEAALGGLAIAQLARRPGRTKVIFNLAHYTVGFSVAAAVTVLIRGGADPLALRGVAAVVVAVFCGGLISNVAVSGILARIQGVSLPEVVTRAGTLSYTNFAANAAVGILAAVVWDARPGFLPVVVVPLAALWWAYVSTVRRLELATRVDHEKGRIERIVAGASDGIALLDEERRVEVWSPVMAALTGLAPVDAVGRPLGAVLRGRDDTGPVDVEALLDRLRPDEPTAVHELQLQVAGADEHIVELAATALFDREGTVIAHVLLLRDVTEARETERLKDDFVMRVSHELRTPLTPIKGFAQGLAVHAEQVTPELLRTALGRIVDRADHMTRLIDDLLAVSTLRDASRRAHHLQPVLPAARVSAVASSVTELGQRPVRVRGATDVHVLADPERLDHVLAVLLSNAARYSPQDAPVTVRIRDAGAAVAIDVIDEGRGIPSDHLERIFDRFHRVEDPMTMTTGGLGIGLFIARRLCRDMRGDLTVESTLGEGSTFTVTLGAASARQRENEPISAR